MTGTLIELQPETIDPPPRRRNDPYGRSGAVKRHDNETAPKVFTTCERHARNRTRVPSLWNDPVQLWVAGLAQNPRWS